VCEFLKIISSWFHLFLKPLRGSFHWANEEIWEKYDTSEFTTECALDAVKNRGSFVSSEVIETDSEIVLSLSLYNLPKFDNESILVIYRWMRSIMVCRSTTYPKLSLSALRTNQTSDSF